MAPEGDPAPAPGPVPMADGSTLSSTAADQSSAASNQSSTAANRSSAAGSRSSAAANQSVGSWEPVIASREPVVDGGERPEHAAIGRRTRAAAHHLVAHAGRPRRPEPLAAAPLERARRRSAPPAQPRPERDGSVVTGVSRAAAGHRRPLAAGPVARRRAARARLARHGGDGGDGTAPTAPRGARAHADPSPRAAGSHSSRTDCRTV